MKRLVAVAALALAAILPAAAPAVAQVPANGWMITSVNLRAGPGTAYPRIVVLPAGAPVAVYGCLEGYRWCDISYGEARGWVAGNYISYEYLGRRAPIIEVGPQVALPIIPFALGAYWDSHYRHRPFYRERPRWESYYHRAPPRVVHPRPVYRPHWDHRPPPHAHRPPPAHYPRPHYRNDHGGRPDYRPDRRPDYRSHDRGRVERHDYRGHQPRGYSGGQTERDAARFNRNRRGAEPGQ